MKILPPLALTVLLLSRTTCLATSGWLLEMPESHGDALVRRFEQKDPSGYRAALKKLDALIKQGTVKEVAKLVAVPDQKQPGWSIARAPENSEYEMQTGQGRCYLKLFHLRSPEKFKSLQVEMSQISVGTSWTPAYIERLKDTFRIFFMRDSNALTEFGGNLKKLTFSARSKRSLMKSLSFYFESGKSPSFKFRDTEEVVRYKSKSTFAFGTVLRIEPEEEKISLDFQLLRELRSKRTSTTTHVTSLRNFKFSLEEETSLKQPLRVMTEEGNSSGQGKRTDLKEEANGTITVVQVRK